MQRLLVRSNPEINQIYFTQRALLGALTSILMPILPEMSRNVFRFSKALNIDISRRWPSDSSHDFTKDNMSEKEKLHQILKSEIKPLIAKKSNNEPLEKLKIDIKTNGDLLQLFKKHKLTEKHLVSILNCAEVLFCETDCDLDVDLSKSVNFQCTRCFDYVMHQPYQLCSFCRQFIV